MVTSRWQGLGQKALLCFVLMSAIFFVLPILLQADDSPEITKEEQLAEIAKIVAGADPKTAAQGAVIAGAEPDAVATAVSTAALSPAPVFGYTPAALTPVVEVYAPPRIISLTGGGGATQSTKIASESKP